MNRFEEICAETAEEEGVSTEWEENENCIEWLRGQKTATVTVCQVRLMNRIKKYAEEYPDKVEVLHDAGSYLVAHVPVSSLRINIQPEREMSEEEKDVLRERLKRVREGKKTAPEE